jgi:hypothetical protein
MPRGTIVLTLVLGATSWATNRASGPPPPALYRLELHDGLFPVVSGDPDKPPGQSGVGLGAKGLAVRGRLLYFVGVIRANEPTAPRVKARDFAGAKGLPIDFEFPAKDPKRPPVLVRGYLRAEENGAELAGFVRVPDEARTGPVEIRAIWASQRRLAFGSMTFVEVAVK